MNIFMGVSFTQLQPKNSYWVKKDHTIACPESTLWFFILLLGGFWFVARGLLPMAWVANLSPVVEPRATRNNLASA